MIRIFILATMMMMGVHGWAQDGGLRLVFRATTDQYGYVNAKGDTVIPMGKYPFCFTERFVKMAIVQMNGQGFVGIDRKERVLFHVFPFDNGPDEVSQGLFRIIEHGKIGYANMRGEIVIRPQYDGAFPFKGGVAQVGIGCTVQHDGEHNAWIGGSWVAINKAGNVVKGK